jgi:hypothetical protein
VSAGVAYGNDLFLGAPEALTGVSPENMTHSLGGTLGAMTGDTVAAVQGTVEMVTGGSAAVGGGLAALPTGGTSLVVSAGGVVVAAHGAGMAGKALTGLWAAMDGDAPASSGTASSGPDGASPVPSNPPGTYRPNRDLPRQPGGEPQPDVPDAAHTQLGTREGRKGDYTNAREFDENGKPVKDVDFTDHGLPQTHPDNPHQHPYVPNPTGGTPQRGPAEPLQTGGTQPPPTPTAPAQ